jgi:hypothetical protein
LRGNCVARQVLKRQAEAATSCRTASCQTTSWWNFAKRQVVAQQVVARQVVARRVTVVPPRRLRVSTFLNKGTLI